MSSIATRLQHIQQRIVEACERSQRNPDDVTLIAVSKTKPSAAIREAWESGQVDFGENYVQEMLEKQEELQDIAEMRWHFIGHLQRNKARKIAGQVSLIHSVGSLALAQELNKRVPEGLVQPILLQCNLSQESSKSGFLALDDVREALKTPLERLEIQGLMEIPAWNAEPEDVRPSFRKLRQWRDRLQDETGQALPHLSMGMSHDLDVAVEEGATFVRVGTAIFGVREYNRA